MASFNSTASWLLSRSLRRFRAGSSIPFRPEHCLDLPNHFFCRSFHSWKRLDGLRNSSPAPTAVFVTPFSVPHAGFDRRLASTATGDGFGNSSLSDFAAPGVPREKVDCVVVGAGVVGLAIARKLSSCGHEVIVLESQPSFGSGISSRNSEVIHAGIYYPPHSLKAKLCIDGRNALYKYCEDRNVPHNRIGKLIVATSGDQLDKLRQLQKNAEESGVSDVRLIEGNDASTMEPNLKCVAALHSPSSGILDSHSFMQTLMDDAESNGCIMAFNSTLVKGEVSSSSSFALYVCDTTQLKIQEADYFQKQRDTAMKNDIEVSVPLGKDFSPEASIILMAEKVINATGLDAIAVANRIDGIEKGWLPKCHLARGNYFSLTGFKSSPFSRLIYPLPEVGGLGIHLTLDLSGSVKFGPDVEWLDSRPLSDSFIPLYEYDVDINRADRFYEAIRKYFPNLPDSCLQPAYSGIRPKLASPSLGFVDFSIRCDTFHGSRKLVNLLGIESPGLTASLAIADYVYSLL